MVFESAITTASVLGKEIMNKKEELLKLAELRQSKVYESYTSIADYANGAYECEYVSPYSKSAHNSRC